MNENWNRWIFASCSKFFDDRKQGTNFYVEGQDPPVEELQDKAILRYNGPFYNQTSRKDFRIEIQLNVLVTTIKNDDDNHKIYRICGIYEKAFEECIPVYRYGDGLDDDGSLLGVLQIIDNGENQVMTNHFGQLTADIRILESTIEGHYRMFLSTP